MNIVILWIIFPAEWTDPQSIVSTYNSKEATTMGCHGNTKMVAIPKKAVSLSIFPTMQKQQ